MKTHSTRIAVDGDRPLKQCKGESPYLPIVRFPDGVVPPAPRFWWEPSETPVGTINGLPAFAGRVCGTNGIFVALETADGGVLFSHKDSFIPAKVERESAKATSKKYSNAFVEF